MHMASIGLFERAPLVDETGALRLEEVRSHVAARLELVPKLRRKVRQAAIPGAPPVWVDDEWFDITAHVRAIGLPTPGGEEELLETCANLFGQLLDRTRPLWEIWLIDGLASGQVVVYTKLHHSVADGLGGVELVTVLLSTEPGPAARPTTAWRPSPPPPLLGEVGLDLGRLSAIGRRWTAAAWRGLRHPVWAAEGLVQLWQGLAGLASLRVPAPRLSLNRRIGWDRRMLVTRHSFDDLHRVGRAHGATVNDVLLAGVAGGIAALLEARGELGTGKEAQVLVPVGLAHNGEVGNRVSALFVRLPVGKDPVAGLRAASTGANVAKVLHEDVAAEFVLDLLAPLPQSVLAGAAGAAHHQLFFNVVVTNVPGPPVPLYALGAKMLEAFPFVPVAGNLTLGVAALSYEGRLNLGILADRRTCPDADVFARGVEDTLDELVRGLDAAPRRGRPGRPAPADRRSPGTAVPRGHRPTGRTKLG